MKVLLFGATGSIGDSLLNLKQKNIDVVGISFFNNTKRAQVIVKKYKIKYYYSSQSEFSNVKSIDELIKKTNPDVIVNAVTGIAGLEYSIKAIQAKKDLCLANKESLVIAGKFINQLAQKNKVKIYPIDSEHSSMYELLLNQPIKNIKQLIITCSGGSCYQLNEKQLKTIKFNQVIKHPNWSMGQKISFDSATLLNKCFEIVEAYHLFNIKDIKAVYHPQSIVHSMVEFKDHSMFMSCSQPDMKIAISLAINKFNKQTTNEIKPLDLNKLNLYFEEIDTTKWKPIKWAQDIINDKNNSLGIIINYANEVAFELFKQDKIKFSDVYGIIEKYTKKYKNKKIGSIKDIYQLIELMNKNKI